MSRASAAERLISAPMMYSQENEAAKIHLPDHKATCMMGDEVLTADWQMTALTSVLISSMQHSKDFVERFIITNFRVRCYVLHY